MAFAYGGWQTSTFVAAEMRNPGRDLSRGLVAGVSENQIPAAVTPSLQSLGDRRLTVTRVERVLDSEDEPLGYTVFTRP